MQNQSFPQDETYGFEEERDEEEEEGRVLYKSKARNWARPSFPVGEEDLTWCGNNNGTETREGNSPMDMQSMML